MVSSLSELEECISDTDSTENMLDADTLANAISAYLKTLSKEARTLFVCRYFYLDSLKDAAKYCGMTESKAKSMLYRIRSGLKEYLSQEGYQL